MSIKFEDYRFTPDWIKLHGIVSETKLPVRASNMKKRCDHCNRILEIGESHIPVKNLKVPSRDTSNSIKQCMSTRR